MRTVVNFFFTPLSVPQNGGFDTNLAYFLNSTPFLPYPSEGCLILSVFFLDCHMCIPRLFEIDASVLKSVRKILVRTYVLHISISNIYYVMLL